MVFFHEVFKLNSYSKKFRCAHINVNIVSYDVHITRLKKAAMKLKRNYFIGINDFLCINKILWTNKQVVIVTT